MPTRPFTETHRSQLLAFLEASDTNVLSLRAAPDCERLAMKLLGSLERDPGKQIAVLGVGAAFETPAAYHGAIAGAVHDDLFRNEDDLAAGAVALASAEPYSPDPSPLPPEMRLADYLERVHRALGGHVRRLVIALRPSKIADRDRFRASMHALSAATASPAVKYVVFESLDDPALQPARTAVPRLAVSQLGADPGPLVKAFLSSPAARVLLAQRGSAGPAGAPSLAGVVASEVKLAGSSLHLEVVEHPFTRRLGFFAAARDAVRAIAPAGGPSPARSGQRSQGPAGASRAEAQLAESAEETARAIVPGGALVLLLDAGEVPRPDELRASIERLCAVASSPRVKYFVVYSAHEAVAAAPSRPSGVTVHTVELTAADMERDLLASLDDPASPPGDRARRLSVLSGFALARKDHDGARELSNRALKESQALGSPADEAFAWMSVGGVLFHDRELGPARDAFAFAAARALEGKDPQLAAQALVQVGHCHSLRKEHAQAEECYRAAAGQCARTGHVLGEAQALIWLGESRRARERWGEAHHAFRDALARLDAAPRTLEQAARPGKIEALERLARMFDEAGMKAEARDAREKARALGSDGKIHEPA